MIKERAVRSGLVEGESLSWGVNDGHPHPRPSSLSLVDIQEDSKEVPGASNAHY